MLMLTRAIKRFSVAHSFNSSPGKAEATGPL